VAPPSSRTPQAVLFSCGFTGKGEKKGRRRRRKRANSIPSRFAVIAELGQDLFRHKPIQRGKEREGREETRGEGRCRYWPTPYPTTIEGSR